MKKLWMVLALLVACGASVMAQSKEGDSTAPMIPLVVHFEMRQVSNTEYNALRGKRTLDSKSSGKLLQSSALVTSTGNEALVHFGGKYPLTYFDPRAQQFQVQYVDIGQKVDVRCQQQGSSHYRVEIRPEFSVKDGIKSGKAAEGDEITSYPSTVVFITENTLVNLQLGQTAIVGRTRGDEVQRVWDAHGIKNADPNIIATLRLEALK